MRQLKIISHCAKCSDEVSYIIKYDNVNEELFQTCQKCRGKHALIIDKGFLLYKDENGDSIEECIINNVDK